MNIGWLQANYSFSFANYHNPARLQFGMLRVFNDDIIGAGRGFPTHPHDNMEIVTIPLQGALAHEDSTGQSGIIRKGDVQIMSAGTGILHSEMNANADEDAHTLQTWVFPKQMNITPRYDQATFPLGQRRNQFYTVVSPEATDADTALWINQDAYYSLGHAEAGTELAYTLHDSRHGAWLFVIEGAVTVAGQHLGRRDSLDISEAEAFTLTAQTESELLLIEVPMFRKR